MASQCLPGANARMPSTITSDPRAAATMNGPPGLDGSMVLQGVDERDQCDTRGIAAQCTAPHREGLEPVRFQEPQLERRPAALRPNCQQNSFCGLMVLQHANRCRG